MTGLGWEAKKGTLGVTVMVGVCNDLRVCVIGNGACHILEGDPLDGHSGVDGWWVVVFVMGGVKGESVDMGVGGLKWCCY